VHPIAVNTNDREKENWHNIALVLVAHGSSTDFRAGEAAFRCAGELRRRAAFAEVIPAFWKQSPRLVEIVESLSWPKIVIVPLLASEGYFADRQIPRALGLPEPRGGDGVRICVKGDRTLYYGRPVGTHPEIARAIVSLAEDAVASRPFPRAPEPVETALFVAGHGTTKHPQSRQAVENHVQTIRQRTLYGETHAVFLEEDPLIGRCYEMTGLPNLIMVPLFIGEGGHAREDLPVCLGESRERVCQRLALGRPGWSNPTERHGKRVWLSPSVGAHPLLLDTILARAREALSQEASGPK
jgi:sirohydrochlorin cobaltochelatase